MKKYNFIYFVVIFIPNGIALPVDAAEYELSDLQYSKIDKVKSELDLMGDYEKAYLQVGIEEDNDDSIEDEEEDLNIANSEGKDREYRGYRINSEDEIPNFRNEVDIEKNAEEQKKKKKKNKKSVRKELRACNKLMQSLIEDCMKGMDMKCSLGDGFEDCIRERAEKCKENQKQPHRKCLAQAVCRLAGPLCRFLRRG